MCPTVGVSGKESETGMEELDLREKASMCPQKPGVYLMHDSRKAVIYVGKAKNLKNRVSQYFQNTDRHTIKTAEMVRRVADFETIVTSTELEAFVLENTLIKHYKPKYNILLKDDKGYPFIRVDTDADYPRFVVAAKGDETGRGFGPYGGRTIAHEVVEILNTTFRLPTCSRKFPRDVGKARPCLRHHLGQCIGVCTGEVGRTEYHRLIDEAILLLEGRSDHLAQELRTQMEACAENLEFEKAALLRDRLQALERVGERQKVVAARIPDTDVVCLYTGEYRSCAAVLHYVGGTLLGKDMAILPACTDEEDAGEMLSEYVAQYYRERPLLPSDVALSHEIPDAELLSEWLSREKGKKVTVLHPQRGQRRRLLEMAMDNAREEARLATAKEERTGRALTLLQEALGEDRPMHRLEAYDISHTGGADVVGVMVVFQDGRPLKSAYRKFKLNQVQPDDYAGIAETLTRRIRHAQEGDEKFLPLPDVFLIDGGSQHVATALKVLEDNGLSIPVLGIVKDDSHRTRGLVTQSGEEIGLRTQPALFALMGSIGEEVHRFAIGFHRELRGKNVTRSTLDELPGVGPARKKALLKRFGGIRAIRAASVEELTDVLPVQVAQQVYALLHEEETQAHADKEN